MGEIGRLPRPGVVLDRCMCCNAHFFFCVVSFRHYTCRDDVILERDVALSRSFAQVCAPFFEVSVLPAPG